MEATLAGLSIGALIYGIIQSRKYSDSNNITTVIPPSLQIALKTYQNEPTRDNLKRLEQLKQQELMELDRVKKQAQDEANRKIAQIMEDAKAQAQRMYAQGKLEEAKNIEKLAQLKRTTVQEDTQANVQELAKRFQSTMTTINTMMTNAQLTSDKNLEKQIVAVTNELRTARNNEAILRNQVSQLQAQLQNQLKKTSSINPRQIEEMRITVENAKRCSYEADMLKRELYMLKAANNGDQNARRISSQFAELRRQLDEAKRNEQQLVYQLQNERARRNSGANASSRYRIQQLESELNNLRMTQPAFKSTGNASKDIAINELRNELEIAQRREQYAVEELKELRSAMNNARRSGSDATAAQQRIYELQSELAHMRRSMDNAKRFQGDGTAAQQRIEQLESELVKMRRSMDNAKRFQFQGVENDAQQRINELQEKLARLNSNANNKELEMANEISKLKNMLYSTKNEYDRFKQDKNVSPNNSALLSNARNEIRDLQRKLNNINLAGNLKTDDMRSAMTIAELETQLQRAKLDNQSTDGIEQRLQQVKSQSSPETQQLASAVSGLINKLEQARANEKEVKKTLRNAADNEIDTSRLKMELTQAQKETQQLRNELDGMKKAASMSPSSMAQAQEIASLQQQLQTLKQSQPNVSKAFEDAQAAKEEVRQLREQVRELDDYRQKVEALEKELNIQRLRAIGTNGDTLQTHTGELINRVIEEANTQRNKAEDEAINMVDKAKSDIFNASSATNVNNLQQQLKNAKNNAQIIQLKAAENYDKMVKHAKELENQVFELQNQNNALQKQVDGISHFPTANSARRQLNDVILSVTQKIEGNVSSGDLGDCLSKVIAALRDAKVDLSTAEKFILDARGNDPRIQQQIEELTKAIKVKDEALLQISALNKENELKLQNVPHENFGPEIRFTINQIIDEAKENMRNIVDQQLACPTRTCPIQTELICDTLPSIKTDLSTDVYDTFYVALKKRKDDLYGKVAEIQKFSIDKPSKIQILSHLYTPPVEKQMSMTNSPINSEEILKTHNNIFVPLVDLEYPVSNTSRSDTIKDTLNTLKQTCKPGILATLHILRDFITKQDLNTHFIEEFKDKLFTPPNDIDFTIHIIKFYIGLIKTILNNAVTFKFTSLYTSKVKELLSENVDTQIQLYDTLTSTAIHRAFFFQTMYKFLYIDITALLHMRKHKNIVSFYTTYLQQYEEKLISQDTVNCAQILLGGRTCTQRFIYIERFVNAIENSLETESNNTTSSARIFYEYLLLYIAYSLPFIISFTGNIVRNIESPSNLPFEKFIDNVIKERLDNNVLTYIKVRNDDDKQYNTRFRVFVNKNTPKNTSLVVKYNAHNFPYFDSDKKPISSLANNKTVFELTSSGVLLVKKYEDEYLLGPFTRVFEHTLTNDVVAFQMTEVINSLRHDNPRPVFLMGYGASGAGKTSSLIYYNKGKTVNDRNGVLMHLCNHLSRQFKYLVVTCYEFYNKVSQELDAEGKIKFRIEKRETQAMNFVHNGNEFVLENDHPHTNKFPTRVKSLNNNSTSDNVFAQDDDITLFAKGTSMGKVMIHIIDVDRFVKATTNNPNSSRSHSLIFVKFLDDKKNINPKRTLIIGDFAGVENAFECNNETQLLGFLRVKEDTPKGKLFYSKEDPSLYGSEGGMRKRHARHTRTNSRALVGGKFERGCEFVRENDTPDFFELGRSDYRVNKKSVKDMDDQFRNTILGNPRYKFNIPTTTLAQLFKEKEDYSMFLRTIFNGILLVNGTQGVDPLRFLLERPQSEVMDMFAKYMKHEGGFLRFLQNTITFTELFSELQKENKEDKGEFVRNTLFNKIKNCCGLKDDETFYDFLQIASKGIELEEQVPESVMKDLVDPKNKNWEQSTINTSGKDRYVLTPLTAGASLKAKTSAISRKDSASYKFFGYIDLEYAPYQSIKNAKDFFTYFAVGSQLYKSIQIERYKIVNNPDQDQKRKTHVKLTVKFNDIAEQIKNMLVGPFYTYLRFQLNDPKGFNATTIVSNLTRHSLTSPNAVPHNNRVELLKGIFANSDKTTIEEFCTAIVKEAFDIIMEMKCRKSYYNHICQIRRQEGYFINNSLRDLREVIKDIMYEKNKDSINISPMFHEPCLPAYCEKSDCFTMNSRTSVLSSIIFDTMVKELSSESYKDVIKRNKSAASVLQDMIIGAFVVINLSKTANNPPPVPYIDTNSVRVALGATGYITKGVVNSCKTLIGRLEEFKMGTVKLNIPPQIWQNISTVVTNGEKYVEDRYNTKVIADNLAESLVYLENISAASLMGTLHYADALAKYNTTKAICAQQTLKNVDKQTYKVLLKKLLLKNVVDPDESYCPDGTTCQYQEEVNIST
jgi:hypothetical protein